MSPTERKILDAAQRCCERWGLTRVSIDDIARDAGVSRATLYRMFPGGKDVVFDALRVDRLEAFFAEMQTEIGDSDSLEDLLVQTVVFATVSLRHDEHLAIMLAGEPGETLRQLTVQGLPRIIRMASLFLAPRVAPFVEPGKADELVDLLSRLVISYFLAPSQHVDLGEPESARQFVQTHILPIYEPFELSQKASLS